MQDTLIPGIPDYVVLGAGVSVTIFIIVMLLIYAAKGGGKK